MAEYRMGELESVFADLIWHNEPISSGALARLALERLNWKRTTTYTVLKRLCQRGLFQNEAGTVTSKISREAFYAQRSRQFVEETFQGSLPAFLSAFGEGQKLSESEIDALQKLIDSMRG